jgi:uncharacterized membrane protein (UPF0127 family)
MRSFQDKLPGGETLLCWRTPWLLLIVVGLLGCAHDPTVVLRTSQGRVPVAVEIAATPDARARGLMYRRDLAPDHGMLFLFPSDALHSFWMKNTVLALDMVFIGSDMRVVGIIANAQPFSTIPLKVERPSRYVLEVRAGFCARRGVAVGDLAEFVRIPAAVQ